jgi:hypothetical protein
MQELRFFVLSQTWCWCLQGAYFFLVVLCTWHPVQFLSLQDWPDLCFWAWVLFEISLSLSILVSLIVTYVLYPVCVKNNVDFSLFFEWPSLLMHNFNLIFMVCELLVNRFPSVNPWHSPYAIFFGMAYILFAWIWEWNGGVFYYFFLNYAHKRAVIFHLGLLAALYVFFFFGWLIKAELISYPTAAPIAIVLALPQVLMFRPYHIKIKSVTEKLEK